MWHLTHRTQTDFNSSTNLATKHVRRVFLVSMTCSSSSCDSGPIWVVPSLQKLMMCVLLGIFVRWIAYSKITLKLQGQWMWSYASQLQKWSAHWLKLSKDALLVSIPMLDCENLWRCHLYTLANSEVDCHVFVVERNLQYLGIGLSKFASAVAWTDGMISF